MQVDGLLAERRCLSYALGQSIRWKLRELGACSLTAQHLRPIYLECLVRLWELRRGVVQDRGRRGDGGHAAELSGCSSDARLWRNK